MIMAKAIDEAATKTAGKKSLALDSFSKALSIPKFFAVFICFDMKKGMIPTIIADNGGYDSGELVSRLRAEHYKGNTTAGLNMKEGTVGDMDQLGILESLKVMQRRVTFIALFAYAFV